MKKLVIMPGGFHPWHAGHTALYQSAKEAFPSADVFVAATADTSTRPFPFKIKKMLAQTAGVPANRFIQVKSPFSAQEITQMYDPEETQLIFVRSEKDRDQQPKAGTIKKNGEPSYLQPYRRNGLEPMSRHAYMAYLPVAQFGPGMTSATEIRAKWPEMTPEQKTALLKTIYPGIATNVTAINKLIEIMDSVLATATAESVEFVKDFDESEVSLLDSVVGDLASVVAMLKKQDYSGAYDLLYNSDLADRLGGLTDTEVNDEPVDIVSTDSSVSIDSDYAEEN